MYLTAYRDLVIDKRLEDEDKFMPIPQENLGFIIGHNHVTEVLEFFDLF